MRLPLRVAPRAVLAVLFALGPVATGAQQPAPAGPPAEPSGQAPLPPQQPPIRSEANFVRVDVFPTRDGRPAQDLTAADFEIREDGHLQQVATFEHVQIRPAGPQSERIEPSSQREMRQALENPRNRAFVLFLDAPHVRVEGSHFIIEPVIRLINRVLGPDDLVAVMLPGMSTDQLTFARKTQITEQQLRDNWTWGERFSIRQDEKDREYEICYSAPNSRTAPGLAARMSARRKERATLEALQDLIRFLHATREARTAVLTVTEGWALYGPDPSLMAASNDPNGSQSGVPIMPPVGVGPDGRLTTRDPRVPDTTDCDADRLALAAIDDEKFLLQIIEEANRANTTFYPIDPRGLAVFDFPISFGVPLDADKASLNGHQNSLRDLAGGTDGLAVINSNDLDAGLRRVSDDLTSYYLLGYYSTNPALDGGYRRIKVSVKQPGVDVRARRGYRAATREEAAAARLASAAPAGDVTAPLDAALGELSRVLPASRLRLQAAWAPGTDRLWVTGELPVAAAGSGREDLAGGATVSILVTGGDAGDTLGTGRVTLGAGDRTFVLPVTVKAPPGSPLQIQARVASDGGGTSPAGDTFRLPGSTSPRPVLFRRGPTTGNRQVATADPRFLRSERVHLELPVADGTTAVSARLLDRTGQPLQVPVTTAARTGTDPAQAWVTADLSLAPLAPGDYVVEISTTRNGIEERVLTAIQLTR